TSPCSRARLIAALVVVGVPWMTFRVAAPGRLSLLRELALLWRGAEAAALSVVLTFLRRRQDASRVVERQRARVEAAYMSLDDRLGELARHDPLRLHHARRLAFFGAGITVIAGLALPILQPSTYTFGDWVEAPFVVLLDALVLTCSARVVGERMMIRLLEASEALRGQDPRASRARTLPIVTLLGGALGMVASFVVVSVAAAACAVETVWLAGPYHLSVGYLEPAMWFIRATAPDALPLGVGIGAILGAGIGWAQPPRGMFPASGDGAEG
ncbi:MAG: hypothetical protein ACO3JL_14720, partial [Myxococcota bacterium]